MSRTRQTDRQAEHGATLPSAAPQGERQPGLRAAGRAVARWAAPVIARHGGGVLARLKAHWPEAIGPELAAVSWPEALAPAGVLKLRVVSTSALQVQHRAPLLIERINLFFGRAVVTRLALVQGQLPLTPVSGRPAPRVLAAGEANELARQVAAVGDPELRDALIALGRAVIGDEPHDG